MAKAEDKDFNDWLNKPVERKQSLTCQTCAYGAKVKDIIRKFMIARAEGKTRRANRDLHDYLIDPKNEINYHLGDSALNTHMRRCERDVYLLMRTSDLENGLARGPAKIDSELIKPRKRTRPKKPQTRKTLKGS